MDINSLDAQRAIVAAAHANIRALAAPSPLLARLLAMARHLIGVKHGS